MKKRSLAVVILIFCLLCGCVHSDKVEETSTLKSDTSFLKNEGENNSKINETTKKEEADENIDKVTDSEIVLSYTGYVSLKTGKTKYKIEIVQNDTSGYTLTFSIYNWETQAELQKLEYQLQSDFIATTIEMPVYIRNINGDSQEDFMLDLGVLGKAHKGVCFVSTGEGKYEILKGYDELCDPFYYWGDRIIYTSANDGGGDYEYGKYIVEGAELVQIGKLCCSYENGHPRYTELTLVDGDMVVINNNVGGSKVDKEQWPFYVDFE